ncbi:MAG: hypothetical protein H6713_04330 [Myxococcales bacterium]|nr:hypothetical protein [Myxococcales bacterium]
MKDSKRPRVTGGVTRSRRAALTLALACVTACAFSPEERDRWRRELEPRVLPAAMGEGAEWFVKNANHGEVNA